MRFRSFLLSALLLAIMTPATLLATTEPPKRTPVLFLEFTDKAGVELTLMVYSDGDSVLAQKDRDHPEGEICSSVAPPVSLHGLEEILRRAGALHLSGTPQPVPNGPRITISFFVSPDQDEKAARSLSNTFSYSSLQGPYLTVDNAVTEFILSNFGNCI